VDHQESRAGTSDLRAQADALRRKFRSDERSGDYYRFSSWKKAFYFVLLVGSIVASTTLLIWDEARHRMVEQVVSVTLSAARPEGQAELFELPPPPPKEAQPRVLAGAPVIVSSGDENVVLYSDTAPSLASEESPEATEEAQGFTAPEITPATKEAYQLLIDQSQIMGQLVEGSLQGYEFRQWQAIQNEPPRFVIDFVAMRALDQQEVHLIWEVNLQEGQVRPLSQAARDLVVQLGSGR